MNQLYLNLILKKQYKKLPIFSTITVCWPSPSHPRHQCVPCRRVRSRGPGERCPFPSLLSPLPGWDQPTISTHFFIIWMLQHKKERNVCTCVSSSMSNCVPSNQLLYNIDLKQLPEYKCCCYHAYMMYLLYILEMPNVL